MALGARAGGRDRTLVPVADGRDGCALVENAAWQSVQSWSGWTEAWSLPASTARDSVAPSGRWIEMAREWQIRQYSLAPWPASTR